VREGIGLAGPVQGIGIDTWAVDYGLIDAAGRLIEDPVHYRDRRTDGIPRQVFQRMPASRLYELTGIQHQPFNTIHQLYAARESASFKAAARVLMIPDLVSYRLTGLAGTEITNASTTGLLDPATRSWSKEIADALDLEPALFAPLREPGSPAGFAHDFDAPVYTVGSHDTASAVAAVPATEENFAYISSGTWSLVGVELKAPIRTEASRAANFTNELGVDGTVRYLRNVMGLWLLQECLRTWGPSVDLAALLTAARHAPARRSVIDAADPAFLPPGDMPARIAEACLTSGQPVPDGRAQTVRCILDSLAEAYRRALQEAAALSGKRIDRVHIVGGGALNTLLCQLTADATGLPVIAGPVEAAAIGNLLVQARAAGVLGGGLDEMRALVAGTQQLRRFEPSCG
jgi:rhamnulokinase